MSHERFELAPGAVLFHYYDEVTNRAAIAHATQQLRGAPGVLDAIPAARSTLVLHVPVAPPSSSAPTAR